MESNRTAVLGALALAAMMGGVLMCLLWAKNRRVTHVRRAAASSQAPVPAPQPVEAPVPEPEREWQPVQEARLDLAKQAHEQGRYEEAVSLDRDHLEAHFALMRGIHGEMRELVKGHAKNSLAWCDVEPVLTRLKKGRSELEGAAERLNSDPERRLSEEANAKVKALLAESARLRLEVRELAKKP